MRATQVACCIIEISSHGPDIVALFVILSKHGKRGFRSRRTKNNVWDELRIISGRRAKQVRISCLINGRISVDSRYFDPLHKPFYALNVDSCPLTTGTLGTAKLMRFFSYRWAKTCQQSVTKVTPRPSSFVKIKTPFLPTNEVCLQQERG